MSEKHKSCFSSCLVKLLIFLLIAGSLLFLGITTIQKIANPNKSNAGLFEREASIKDFAFDEKYSFPVSVEYSVTPYYDIEDLQITFYYHNSSGNVFETHVKQLGNVVRGQTYTFKVSLTEFSASEIASFSHGTYTVTRGTISYFN